jgi:hypothetical protein
LKRTNQPYFCFSRTNLTGTSVVPRLPGPLQLTHELADALDAVHFAAEKHCITAELQPGDLYFLNNHLVLHGREAFHDSINDNEADNTNRSDDRSDGSSPRSSQSLESNETSSISTLPETRERHKMRLWLRSTDARPTEDIPDALKPRWHEVFGEDSLKQGVWAFDKVHDKNLVMASRNDEMQSFS